MSQDLKASVSFVGDGITTKFYFGFDYINKQFIKVTVGSDDTLLSYPSDYIINEKEVELVEAPAKGTPIRIYRQTDTSRIIEWTDGTFIKASQMTLENVQQLHLIEEAQDYVIINGMSKYPDGVNFNALGARVINVSDPKEPQDAVTKHYMESVQDGFVSRNTSLLEQTTTQATNAKNSASSSATSASQSASSASASETSNQSAKKWAESTESPDGLTDSDSSTGKTQSSKEWAMESKAQALNSHGYADKAQDIVNTEKEELRSYVSKTMHDEITSATNVIKSSSKYNIGNVVSAENQTNNNIYVVTKEGQTDERNILKTTPVNLSHYLANDDDIEKDCISTCGTASFLCINPAHTYYAVKDLIDALYYKTSETISGYIHTGGYVTNGGKGLAFSIPLGKHIKENVMSIQASSMLVKVRLNGAYIVGSANGFTEISLDNEVAKTTVSLNEDGGFVNVTCYFSTKAITDTNNVVGIEAKYTLEQKK